MAKVLTIKGVDAEAPGAARREVADGHTVGLYLVVQSSGVKSWAVRYRAAGKPAKLTLGPYPALDLKGARDKAREALAVVARGGNPGADRKAARAAATAKPEVAADLVEDVVAQFIARYLPRLRDSSRAETTRILNRDVVAPWRGRRLSAIGRADVVALLDTVTDRGSPVMANRVLAALRRMCGWAVERGVIQASPCDGVKAPAAERSRDRVLDDMELMRLLRACDGVGWPFGPLIRLLALTGQRRDEVAEMRWSEVDFGARLWTIPRERVKNGVAHAVPLSAAALAVLAALPRIGDGAAGLVFTTNGRTPVQGFGKAKDRLDAAMAADGAALPPWRLHDLRRTAATGMARLGVMLPVVERVLNHTSGTFGGVAGVYQRHDFAAEKRDALDRWGEHVGGLKGANVVPLRVAGDAA